MYTMSTSKSYHHGDLRPALIQAALELLREGGTEALSLRAVTRRAGVSAMAPYRHFPEKEALLASVAAHGFNRLRATLSTADSNAADAREALAAQGVAYVRFACEDPALFRLMFGAAQPRNYPELGAAGDAAYGVLAGRVASFCREAERADVALTCWSVVHGLASLLVDGQLRQDASPVMLAERVTRLVLRSVR
jgi:AcrR family transcriptional regulator